jgi:hypothetical protein
MTNTYTPEGLRAQRAYGSLGGLVTAAKYDVIAISSRARAGFVASFGDGHECALCPLIVIPADLPPEERERRAVALRKVHMKRLALKRHGL